MNNSLKAMLLGVLASIFFAVTFILNRSMTINGGSWIWSASLRFFWMIPFFLIIVVTKRRFNMMWRSLKQRPLQWILWSTIGFGIFYAPLTFAAAYQPSWLIASTWQFTIIAGILLTPLINRNKKNKKSNLLYPLIYSSIIIVGIVFIQITEMQILNTKNVIYGILPVLIASIAYPLGNRKMIQITQGKLDVFQRILGMLICSLPFWIILSSYDIFMNHKIPDEEQLIQTLIVAISSGVIATALFFRATEKVYNDKKSLAMVEATQSTEVLFALIGEILILSTPLPTGFGILGIILILLGIILHSLKNKNQKNHSSDSSI